MVKQATIHKLVHVSLVTFPPVCHHRLTVWQADPVVRECLDGVKVTPRTHSMWFEMNHLFLEVFSVIKYEE